MRITCFLTVCAYLSSTVSADELRHIKRIAGDNSQDELVFEDVTPGKGINFGPEFYPELFTLQKPQSLVPKEIPTGIFQFPTTVHRFHPKPQQFQQHKSLQPQPKLQPQYHYNRGRSRQPMKRLKTRSIVGASIIGELNDNQVIAKDVLPVADIPEEKPIHIKPVLRVTKKNVLDSIVDILKQLLVPSKNEPGPIVGPIKIPGSERKIFLRLLEPLDQSHVVVRFVTQMKVPVADLSEPKEPVFPIPPVVDPVTALLNSAHGGVVLPDATFSSSNRHAVRTKLVGGKGRPPPSAKGTNNLHSVKSPPKDLPAPATPKPFNAAEDNKNGFPNEQPNLGNQGSYYHYQSADEALKEVNAILNDTASASDASKPLEPWYQLSTHRLPIKQIAPLYPLTAMDHDSSPQANTYKAPSDPPGIGPNAFSGSSGSYEQYNSAPPGSYAGSYASSYAGSYESQYTASPSSYSTLSYDKLNDANPTANTYSVPFPKQNEFNSAPSPYASPYRNQNEFNSGLSAYSTSYSKQPDLYGEPSSYSNSHEKPAAVLPTSGSYATIYNKQNNEQTGPNTSDAFRVIDPPSYLPNQSNQSFERGRPPNYSSYNLNDVSSSTKQHVESTNDPVWGKTKREKSQLGFENSPDIFSNINEDRRTWEPLTFFQEKAENADWRDAFKTTSEPREMRQQPRKSSRNTASLTERGTADQRMNEKRRSSTAASTTRSSSRCLSEDGCEQAKPTTTAPTLHSTVKVVETTQETTVFDIEPTAVKSTASSSPVTAEALTMKLDTTKSPMSSSIMTTTTTTTTTTTSSTTAKPPLLIRIENPAAKSPLLIKVTKQSDLPRTKSAAIGGAERLIAHEALNKQAASKARAKPTTSSTTENTSLNSATKAPNVSVKKLQLPKRPMIMKKPTFIMKRGEATDTTTTTQKPTTSNTTKRAFRTKYQGAKTKSTSAA